MMVYFLVDPADPNTARYVGRSSREPATTLADHLSAARIRRRRGIEPTPVMAWILELLDAGSRPLLFKLADNLSDAQASELVEALTEQAGGTYLNNPAGARWGKPPGMLDSPEGRANKQRAAKDLAERRAHSLEVETERRRKKGYPHPELLMNHPLNWEYHCDQIRKTKRRATDAARANMAAAMKAHHARRVGKV